MSPAIFIRKAHEYDDVYSYWFRHPTLRYEAGRYVHLQIGALWSGGAVRELSFASAPHEEELMFTVHIGSGSRYKRRLHTLRPGDRVRAFLVGGNVVLPKRPTGKPLVFIAGGVGMAPFRSLILEAHRRGGFDLRVIQVQRGDFLYRHELEPLVAEYAGVRPEELIGHVRAQAAATPEALFYTCGSRRLITTVRDELTAAGVDKRSILIENFG
ncbi:ferredoxin--NADP reductase [Nonomuraea sp. NPDC049400]|uniref:ferredoxin--NADP reductase n=1 Tax=Nonomuraea sp. NPDC049400 TaxID=3364352 RepID=UPI003797BE04